jgi:hypothetical protein
MSDRDGEENRERLVQAGPGEVIEGEDEIPREPAPPLDPYTPEPGARPGEERAFTAMRFAVLVLAAVVAVLVVWAILR